MSGGSHNYLFRHDAGDLLDPHAGHLQDLKDMAETLTEMGVHDAAKETEELVRFAEHFLRVTQVRMDALSDLWKAVEWSCSGDSGPEQLRAAVRKYRSLEK